jgi:hypothetical protein
VSLRHIFQYKFTIFFSLLGLIYLCAQTNTGDRIDFRIFYMAAQEMSESSAIYNVTFSKGDIQMPGNPYCPMFILCLLPFSFLPYKICLFLWYIFNVGLLILIIKKLSIQYTFNRIHIGIVLFAILLFARSMLSLFQNGQVNILMLYLMIYGLLFIFEDRPILGSFLLASGVLLKIMPILFIPYLVWRRRWIEVVYVFLWIAFLILIPSVYIGWYQNIRYFTEWFHMINPLEHVFVSNNQIAGRDHFGIDEFCIRYVPMITHSEKMISYMQWVGRALILGIVAFCCRSSFRRKHIHPILLFWEISLISLSTSLLFPVQLLYSFVSSIPMCFYISQYFIGDYLYQKKRYLYSIVLFLILTLFCSDLFLGKTLMYISLHYKCISFGYILLAMIQISLRPLVEEMKILND